MHISRLTLLIVPLVLSCAWRPISAPVTSPAIPVTESECLARGGTWDIFGFPVPDKPKSCGRIKATDSGKVCNDSSQCQGLCIAPAPFEAGSKVTGTCSEYLEEFGNVYSVERGIVEYWNID